MREHSSHGPSGGHVHTAPTRVLGRALALTLLFAVVEVFGGIWTGSLALLADATHMFSDALAIGVALAAALVSRLPPDDRRTMGYRRAEVLGAFVNASALVVLAIWIGVEAVKRLASPPAVAGLPMMAIALGGLAVNVVIAFVISHAHIESINLRAALLHVIGDALGSVGALVAGAMVLWGDWRIADPIASLAISAFIGQGAVPMVWESLSVLMQSAPKGVDVAALRAAILAEEGVCDIHQFHLWCLTPGINVLTLHLVVEDGADLVEVTGRVRRRTMELAPLSHVTVQPENGEYPCLERREARHREGPP
jgi:cobalt-zinc-cadmium efflux system protein